MGEIPHIRSAIVNPNTGAPTKIFYDLLALLSSEASSDDLGEIFHQLAGSDGEAVNIQSTITAANALAAMQPDSTSEVANLKAQMQADKVLSELHPDNTAEVSELRRKVQELETALSLVPDATAEVSELRSSLQDLEAMFFTQPDDSALLDELRKDVANKTDYFLEVSKGNIPGHTAVGKFGEAPSGIQTSPTDIWSRADTTPTQQIWLAPTAANTHTIKSDSAADVSGGTGTTSVTVFYLPDWDTAEASVTVTGDINTGVSMGVSCVMINRMVALPQSTSTGPGPNKGTITATAAAPSATTITSAILPEEGQTEQAIYGFPSGYKVYIDRWSGGIDKSTGAAASADFQIRFNPNPDVQTLAFIRKRDSSVQSTGTSKFENRYKHDNQLTGPGIVKIQAIASAADVDGYSEFDLILVKDGF